MRLLKSLAIPAIEVFLTAAQDVDPLMPDYAPYYVDCPPNLRIVRRPHGLSEAEAAWVHGRKAVAAEAFSSYLTRLNLSEFDLEAYITRITEDSDWNMPTLAFANSGGGWRSAFTGVGGIRAFDGLTPGAVEQKTGGLLQSLTYYAGLSGGSWTPSSYVFHNYPSIDDLVTKWQVDINRFTATTDSEEAVTWQTYFDQITPKFEAGFNVSTADLLGRGFAYEYIPGPNGGMNVTWSSITSLSNFADFLGPMPFLQASSLTKSSFIEEGLYAARENAINFEWTPFEFGSWDIGFTPTKYVGTLPDENGTAEQCVVNLDQTSFVMGSAAAAYNYWLIGLYSNGTLGQFSRRSIATGLLQKRQSLSSKLFDSINEAFNRTFNLSISQIANPSIPNPFGGSENITLSDSSGSGQAIPFWPLIQPERNVDLIFAWDDDGGDDEPYHWNNGTNMWNTYNLAKAAGLPFPQAPPPTTFLARNYTLKPTLFGCNSSLTTTGDASSPIVIYLTNAPWSWYSNFSWTTMNMSYTEFDGVLDNSFNFVTMGNGTFDSEWAQCIGCAAIDRSLERMNMTRTDQCERCFERHCWDGTTSELPENFVLDPSLQLDPSMGFLEWTETHPFSGPA